MSKKIFSVTLKEREVHEIDGEFKEIFKNEKKHPLVLTNYSLKKGRDMGILKTSLLSDLLDIEAQFKEDTSKEEQAKNLIRDLSEDKIDSVIYLALIGANPNTEYSFDDFLQRFHDDISDKMILYFNLLQSAVENEPNKFAEGMNKSTRKPGAKEKK